MSTFQNMKRKLLEVITVLIYKNQIITCETLRAYCSLFKQGEKLLNYIPGDLINAAIITIAREGLAIPA